MGFPQDWNFNRGGLTIGPDSLPRAHRCAVGGARAVTPITLLSGLLPENPFGSEPTLVLRNFRSSNICWKWAGCLSLFSWEQGSSSCATQRRVRAPEGSKYGSSAKRIV